MEAIYSVAKPSRLGALARECFRPFACVLHVVFLSVAFVSAQDPPPNPAAPARAANPTPQRPPVITPKAQGTLDKTIQALGGPAYLNFKRLTTTGRLFAIEDGNTTGMAPFESHMEFPDKRRFSYGKKEPVILVNNGDQGWELDRFGTINQTREQMRSWRLSSRYGLENLLRLRIHEPGILIQDAGTDFIDNFPARVITIIDPHEIEIKLYVSKTTYLPVRVQYKIRNAHGDDWDIYADAYADYRPFQGIQTPLHITHFLNDERISEIYRSSAKYDMDYPPSYFQSPQ